LYRKICPILRQKITDYETQNRKKLTYFCACGGLIKRGRAMSGNGGISVELLT